MVNNGSTNERGLIRAGNIFISSTDFVRFEVLIVMDFRGKMPSVIERAQEGISKAKTLNFGRRNMRDHILIMDNSKVFRNSIHSSFGKVNITNSGGTESPEFQLILVDNVVAGKIKSSESSKSTTQTVTSHIELKTRMLLDQISNMRQKSVSDLGLISSVEILESLGVLDATTKTEVDTSRKTDFLDKLSGSVGSSESKNDSSFTGVDKTGVS